MSSITLPAIERASPAAPIAGAVIWLDALLARILFQADPETVWFLGHRIPWVCSLRARFGLPCPTCGLTRAMILTLHGHLHAAWSVAPSGPVFLFGLLAAATALLLLPLFPRSKPVLRRATLACAAAATIFWLADWFVRFKAAL